jgi:hypothetical protein
MDAHSNTAATTDDANAAIMWDFLIRFFEVAVHLVNSALVISHHRQSQKK